MTRCGWIIALLASLLLATAVEAKPKEHKGDAAHQNCPPGLAKKDPPCIPPGQAKNSAPSNDDDAEDRAEAPREDEDFTYYRPGDRLRDDYVVMIDPTLYRPNPGAIFVRSGDYLYRIDRSTGIVLDRLGPATDWTWNWADTDLANCPPRLATIPPCGNPRLASNGETGRIIGRDLLVDPYGIGDLLPNGYVPVIDPQLYAPNDTSSYVRSGDSLYRIDGETGLILDLIGNLFDLLG